MQAFNSNRHTSLLEKTQTAEHIGQGILTGVWSRNVDKNPLIALEACYYLVLMKRITLALMGTLALLVLGINESPCVNLVLAESSSLIEVESPNNSVIYGQTVPLTVNISRYMDLDGALTPVFSVLRLDYRLDNAPSVNIMSVPDAGWMSGRTPPFQTSLFLFGVSDGNHKIEVMAQGYYETEIGVYTYNVTSTPAYFSVDTVPPNIAILSPLNRTYTTPEEPLIFVVNESSPWKGYSLDGQDTVFAANITLPALPVGSHTLKVYANDTAGNVGSSEIITFTIAETKAEPFPAEAIVGISGASLVALGLGLLVYFKKRKR
jgi:hypothetical protein